MPFGVCFLHVGSELDVPTMMVSSVRKFHPDIFIHQLTDEKSPQVEGVSEVTRYEFSDGNLMKFRLQAYADTTLSAPSFFLDTDMLLIRPIDFESFSGEEVVLLRRTFHADVKVPQFGTNPRGDPIELVEHQGRTLGQMHPFIACFQFISNPNFWRDCLQRLDEIHPKFQSWYGDQEVLRYIATSSKYSKVISEVPESKYACLPDFFPVHRDAVILHFKGAKRKSAMTEWHKKLITGPVC